MNSSSASMAREELKESALRVESLAAQLSSLQKEVCIPINTLLLLVGLFIILLGGKAFDG